MFSANCDKPKATFFGKRIIGQVQIFFVMMLINCFAILVLFVINSKKSSHGISINFESFNVSASSL